MNSSITKSPQRYARIGGLLMTLAGLCYLGNSFALLPAPALASALLPFVLLPAFVGELCFALWLTFKGVNVDKWPLQCTRENT
jgi:hypothetical protein